MHPDENKKRFSAKTRGDQFVDSVRAQLERHLDKQKKKGIKPKSGKLTIIQMPKKEGVPDWRENLEKAMAERKKPPLPGPHPTVLIDALVRDYLTPYLKEHGFRKKARRFWQDYGEIVEVITIWKDEYNDAWQGGFAVELGIYWKKYQQELGGHYAAEVMPPTHCLLVHRLTREMDKINDHWWEFKPNVDIRALADEVISDFECHGVPWLKSRHNPKYIREFLNKNGERLQRVAKYFEEAKALRDKQPPRRNDGIFKAGDSETVV